MHLWLVENPIGDMRAQYASEALEVNKRRKLVWSEQSAEISAEWIKIHGRCDCCTVARMRHLSVLGIEAKRDSDLCHTGTKFNGWKCIAFERRFHFRRYYFNSMVRYLWFPSERYVRGIRQLVCSQKWMKLPDIWTMYFFPKEFVVVSVHRSVKQGLAGPPEPLTEEKVLRLFFSHSKQRAKSQLYLGRQQL